MSSATILARGLLESEPGQLEELRVREFPDDESAHDDELHGRLLAEFSADFDAVQSALSAVYDEPIRTGAEDDDDIPLNGVFRFAVWKLADRHLFAAAAHEDRGCPLLLVLGTIDGDPA